MPTFLRSGPFRVYVYSHEPNEPPHVHVDAGEATCKLWLDEVAVARSRGFRAHEISAIVRLVSEHRQALLEAWHEYFG